MPNKTDLYDNCAIILAGGEGKRLGSQDKGLIKYKNKYMIEHVISNIKPYNLDIIISANRHLDIYQSFGYPVIQDIESSFQGPLMGIYSVISQSSYTYYFTFPCDTPSPPYNLISKLKQAYIKNPIASVAYDGERLQNLFMFIHHKQQYALKHFLDQGKKKVGLWLQEIGYQQVDFSDQKQLFKNFNTPEDFEDFPQTSKRFY